MYSSSRPPPVNAFIIANDYFLLIINQKGIYLIMNKTVKAILTIIKYVCTALLGYGASTL